MFWLGSLAVGLICGGSDAAETPASARARARCSGVCVGILEGGNKNEVKVGVCSAQIASVEDADRK